ncbi:MAG: sensor histidine kinase [Sphingobacteriales bacterium]
MHTISNEAQLILITSTALILLLGIVVVAALLIQQKRKYRYRQQLADIQGLYEKTLLQTELKIREETFKAISQNLHDNIGSNISTAMLLLYKDEAMTENEIETNRKEAIIILDKIVDDLKHIARSLNFDYLNEIGLSEAIRQRIQQLEKTKKYEIVFYMNKAPRSLNLQKQVILFYIFQEAINNISTHANAKNIIINLSYGQNELSPHIKDDGIGIEGNDDSKKPNSKGSGLLNMKNHAAMIDAQLNINSENRKGTEIILTVPDPYQP